MYIGLPRGETYVVSRWVFLRAFGIIYFVAFVSLGTQVAGLMGEHGILPAASFMEAVHERFGSASHRIFPTLCWLNSSDAFLRLLCVSGASLSILLFMGIASVPVLVLLWTFYLSLFTVGRDFLSFQWDTLLLETGFLTIFFAPLKLRPFAEDKSPPSRAMLWLFWWLLFRVMFSSGIAKLTSGDPVWRSLTALTYHYETQPIPSWISWYAHHWPVWFHKLSAAVMFFIELAVPFFIFGSRKIRYGAFALLVFLQLLIMATGNYGFFNLLTVALCFLILDDEMWPAFLRRYIHPDQRELGVKPRRSWPRWITGPVAVMVFMLSISPFLNRIGGNIFGYPLFIKFQKWTAPYQITNEYGLFAVMTTTRPEIVVEGSEDGQVWKAYEFKFKPGDLSRPPEMLGPHMPRLDWQMWFAALGSFERDRWFPQLCMKLLEGSPAVLRLLRTNPFPSKPPKFIRTTVYDYQFTSAAERAQNGNWWKHQYVKAYSPVLTLRAHPSLGNT